MSAFDKLNETIGGGGQMGLFGHIMKWVEDPQHGGLRGLVGDFEKSGLGAKVGSWVSSGMNQAISPAEMQKVLGPDRLQKLSTITGLSPDQMSAKLATILPEVIDKMTPAGTMPGGAAPPTPGGPAPAAS